MTTFQDTEKESELPLTEVSVDHILDAQRKEHDLKQEKQRLLSKALKERGLFMADLTHDDMFNIQFKLSFKINYFNY